MDKLIEKCPDETYPVETDEGVNNEDDDEKEITSENEDGGVVHINITENEKETIRNTLNKVI